MIIKQGEDMKLFRISLLFLVALAIGAQAAAIEQLSLNIQQSSKELALSPDERCFYTLTQAGPQVRCTQTGTIDEVATLVYTWPYAAMNTVYGNVIGTFTIQGKPGVSGSGKQIVFCAGRSCAQIGTAPVIKPIYHGHGPAIPPTHSLTPIIDIPRHISD
jgi:hypothetical protein